MKSRPISRRSSTCFRVVVCAIAIICTFGAQSALADFDNVFVFINGDSAVSTMTQGDLLAWGSNCDIGTTINWEIWYDANSNLAIDPAVDFLLNSENITDGNAVTEADPILDGYTISETFPLSAEPGVYIFKATDIAADSSLQKTITVVPMPSPPNQLSGQVILPGVSVPSSQLANKAVFAESDAGVFIGMTDNMGAYSMNIGSDGTGLEFFVGSPNYAGFVAPDGASAVVSGVVSDVDFMYENAVDSIWGFVEDETGTALGFETNVGASSYSLWREATTSGGRYAIYFTGTEDGEWWFEFDSRVSPDFLSPEGFQFRPDTMTSFRHDFVLTRTDTMIYAIVTENGGEPLTNYRVDAHSWLLAGNSEAVSGMGSDNLVTLHVSSLDAGNWSVSVIQWDDDYPLPPGLIVRAEIVNVAPGDTVELNLVDGQLISSTITQDPGDGPIVWGDVYIGTGSYNGSVDGGGVYWLYTDTGYYFINIGANGYITDPAWRNVYVTGDTTTGLGFTINETHCHVSGALTNEPLPLDGSHYEVTALTGVGGTDGYYVSAQVDAATGTYSMDLCDGDWTITPPYGIWDVTSPGPAALTIGESPDVSRTLDFAYSAVGGCCLVPGDANKSGGGDITDLTFFIEFMFGGGPGPVCMEEFDNSLDCFLEITDLTIFVDYMFGGGSLPACHDCGR